MSKLIFLVVAVLATNFLPEQAQAQCGASWEQVQGPYPSDPYNGVAATASISVYRSDLRSVTVRSSSKKTRFHSVMAYEANSRQWYSLFSNLQLSENEENTICIPRNWNVTEVEARTTGSRDGKFRVILGFN